MSTPLCRSRALSRTFSLLRSCFLRAIFAWNLSRSHASENWYGFDRCGSAVSWSAFVLASALYSPLSPIPVSSSRCDACKASNGLPPPPPPPLLVLGEEFLMGLDSSSLPLLDIH